MCGCKNKCNCNITSTTKGEKGDASSVASLGYKVYVALLTQAGTNAPVATVLQNTLGGTVVWTRSVSGSYIGTLANSFTLNKTFCVINCQKDAGENTFNGVLRLSINEILVTTATVSTQVLGDDMLNGISLEIRVYN